MRIAFTFVLDRVHTFESGGLRSLYALREIESGFVALVVELQAFGVAYGMAKRKQQLQPLLARGFVREITEIGERATIFAHGFEQLNQLLRMFRAHASVILDDHEDVFGSSV